MNDIRHPDVKAWRDRLRELNLCICGPAPWALHPRSRVEHGPVVSGGRCQRCIEIKRRTH